MDDLALDAAPPAKRRVGRPSKYGPELAERIVTLIAEGGTITGTCAEVGITKRTLYTWLDLYPQDFGEAFHKARQMGAHSFVDQIAEVVADIRSGAITPSAGQAALSGLKWLAEKLAPGVYGNHVEGARLQIIIESSLFGGTSSGASSKGELVLEAQLPVPEPAVDPEPEQQVRRRTKYGR